MIQRNNTHSDKNAWNIAYSFGHTDARDGCTVLTLFEVPAVDAKVSISDGSDVQAWMAAHAKYEYAYEVIIQSKDTSDPINDFSLDIFSKSVDENGRPLTVESFSLPREVHAFFDLESDAVNLNRQVNVRIKFAGPDDSKHTDLQTKTLALKDLKAYFENIAAHGLVLPANW